MLVPFGWSVGDIFATVEFISKVIQALKEGSGARQQYATACTFLDVLQCTLARIAQYVGGRNPASSSNVEVNMLLNLVRTEVEPFRVYIEETYPALLGNQGWMKQKMSIMWWTRDQMNSRILQLKQAISDALVALNTTILLDSVEDLKINKELQENYVRQNMDLLVDIYKRIRRIETSVYRDTATKKSAIDDLDLDVGRIQSAALQNREAIISLASEEKRHGAIYGQEIKQAEANLVMIGALDQMLDEKLGWFCDYLTKQSRANLSAAEVEDLNTVQQQVRRSRGSLAEVADNASTCLGTIGSALGTIRSLDNQQWSQWMAPAAKHLSGYGSLIDNTKVLVQTTPKLFNSIEKYFGPSETKSVLQQSNKITRPWS